MKTAFEMAKKWGIVPKWEANPPDRAAATEAFREQLKTMAERYREKTAGMKSPPLPGPRPRQWTDQPDYPEAQPMPPEPPRPTSPLGLPTYPTDDQLAEYLQGGPRNVAAVEAWRQEMVEHKKALEAYRPLFEAARAKEEAILADYTARNHAWLDGTFWPGEAERVLWEAAADVAEEAERARRAAADLLGMRRAERKQRYEAWLPLVQLVGWALAGLSAIAYVGWQIFS